MANIITKRKVATYFDGQKAVDLWGDNLDGWAVLSGDGKQTLDADYYKFIPTLYRAVQLRAYSVSTMPFEILKGKTVYDSSADWKNKVGFMPNPATILQLIESALVISGRAYLFRERNDVVIKRLWYHLPDRVTPKINYDTGKIEYFERPNKQGTPKKFATEDYIYFWLPDPYVEMGPPINYPAKAAANACGVLLNIDLFANNFFGRGAIKAMLLTVKGMPGEAERSKLEEWWRRVVGGVKNAFGAKVVNAEAVTPVVVGEGMKELENVTIGQEKREDISIAVGIPMSILFANAANYATSQQDELNYLTKTIIPECEFIASVLNEQLFTPLGLHMNFLPETLDAMQEDETARAQAMNAFMDAIDKAGGFEMAQALFAIYGVEVDDDALKLIEAHFANKQAKAEEMARQLAQQPKPPEQPAQGGQEQPQREPPENPAMQEEVKRWERKAINAVKKNKPANVDFESDIIPLETHERVMVELAKCKTQEDVHQVFANVELAAHTPAEITALLEATKMHVEAIKLGVEALKASA